MIRIDAVPDAAKAAAIGLDRVDADATQALKSLSAEAIARADRDRRADIDALLRPDPR